MFTPALSYSCFETRLLTRRAFVALSRREVFSLGYSTTLKGHSVLRFGSGVIRSSFLLPQRPRISFFASRCKRSGRAKGLLM
jgi:hypothetical protein